MTKPRNLADLVNGINNDDIAANAGIAATKLALVTGATSRSVDSKLRDTISVKDYGAVGDGVTNDSPAFIAARTAAHAAGKRIYVPAGTYKLNQVLSSSENLIMEGDGPSSVLDFTGTITGGNYAIEAFGTATQIQELTNTATIGTYQVTFASAPSLAVGDVFVIFNPTQSSWSGFRENYFAGEWCEVDAIAGSTVTLKNRLYDTYVPANVDVYKITSPVVSLRNLNIKGTTITGLIRPVLCLSPVVEGITATHANNSVVYFDRCFKPTVLHSDISNNGDGGDDYGIAIGNSQHTRVIGGNIFSRRHAITTGGNLETCAVPVRDFRAIGCVLKNDPASATYAADFHGNTEDSSYIGCSIYGGATWQGKDNEYVDCMITPDVAGRVIYAAEIKGGTFSARGCKLITYVDPSTGNRGIIDIGGNSNTAFTPNSVLKTTFNVTDCFIFARNITTSTAIFRFVNRGSTAKVNFNLQGLTFDIDAAARLLFTSNYKVTNPANPAGPSIGTADSEYVIIDNLINLPSASPWHLSNCLDIPAGSTACTNNYLDFPHRLPRQSGSVVVSCPLGQSSQSSDFIYFGRAYPRTPNFQISGVGAIFVGTKATASLVRSVDLEKFRVATVSSDNTVWDSTGTRTIYWEASFDELSSVA